MSRVKVKSKKIAIGPGGDDAANVLESLLKGDLDIGVAYPKYKNVAKFLEAISEALRTMIATPIFEAPQFSNAVMEIRAYCENIQTAISGVFSINMDRYVFDLKTAPQELQDQFKKIYPEWKTLPIIRQAIETCDKLYEFNDKIQNPSIEFIHNIPGASWCPLKFTSLDLKGFFVFIDPLPKRQAIADVMFACLKILQKFTMQIYEAYSRPDIDVQNFVKTVIDCMGELKKMPELSRCKTAFKHIQRSAELFETNFDAYYKDFVDTKDAKVILQNFITDVSQDAEYDASTIREFQAIIKFYQKKAQSKASSNPQALGILNAINEQMLKVSEMAPNLSGKKQRATGASNVPDAPANTPVEDPEAKLRERLQKMSIEELTAYVNAGKRARKNKK